MVILTPSICEPGTTLCFMIVKYSSTTIFLHISSPLPEENDIPKDITEGK